VRRNPCRSWLACDGLRSGPSDSSANRPLSCSTRQLYRFGRIGFIDVLSAEAALADAESALASSQAQLIDRQVDLFLALGGGWSPSGPGDAAEAGAAQRAP